MASGDLIFIALAATELVSAPLWKCTREQR